MSAISRSTGRLRVNVSTSTGVSNAVDCTFATPVADANGLQLSVAAVSTGTVTIAP